MKTKLWIVRVRCVQRSVAEIEIEAETRGDAGVIAERVIGREGERLTVLSDEVEIESVSPSGSEAGRAA